MVYYFHSDFWGRAGSSSSKCPGNNDGVCKEKEDRNEKGEDRMREDGETDRLSGQDQYSPRNYIRTLDQPSLKVMMGREDGGSDSLGG